MINEEMTLKVHAVFLTALMVLSLVAMSATFAGAAAANTTSVDSEVNELGSFDTVWEGQTVNISDENHPYSPGERVLVYNHDFDGDDELVTTVDVTDDGYLILDTNDVGTGSYYFQNSGGEVFPSFGDDPAPFDVIEQTLDIDADDSVANLGDTEANYEFSSEREFGEFDVIVNESDGEVSGEELENLFADAGAEVIDETDDESAVIIENLEDEEYVADFEEFDEGDYEFNFNVTDTTAEGQWSITVEDGDEGDATFGEVIDTERGGVAEIEVEFTGATDEAELVIGNEENTGYELIAQVDAPSEDNSTVLRFNTYEAGESSPSGDVLTVDEDYNGSVTVLDETSLPDNDLIGGGQYQMDISSDDESAFPDDRTQIILENPSVDGVTSYTSANADFDDADDIEAAIENGSVVERDSVTEGDYVTFYLETNAYDGMVDTATTPESGFQSLVSNERVGFDIEHDEIQRNQELVDFDFTASQFNVIDDDEGFYLVSPVDGLEFGSGDVLDVDEMNVNVTTLDEKMTSTIDASWDSLEHDDLNASTPFGIEERELSVDEPIIVSPSDSTVDGELNVAPDTEIEGVMQADESQSNSPTIQRDTVMVDEEGEFEFEFSFTSFTDGEEFDVVVSDNVLGTEEFSGQIEEESADMNLTGVSVENVTVGEQLTFVSTVSNDGGVGDDVTVTLGGDFDAEATEFVDAGEEEVVEITVDTDEMDAGDYEYVVSVEDEEMSGNVTVEGIEQAFTFDDVSVSADEVEQGDVISVDATIFNSGSESGNVTVTLFDEEGDVSQSQDVEIDGEGFETIVMDIETEDMDVGEYEYELATEDDSESIPFNVTEPSDENGDSDGTDTDGTDTGGTDGDGDADDDGAGFGVVVALAALIGAALLAIRNRKAE